MWFSTTCDRRLFSSACSRRSDSPLPPTVVILHYQRDPFGASGYIYCYLLKGRCFLPLLLLEFVLLPLSAESKEPRALIRHFSLERRTSPPKRERDSVSQEGATELSRVQKKIFQYSVFGRLLNRNVLYDVWASFRLLLSLDFPPRLFTFELSRLFSSFWSEHISVCVCVYKAWCCAQQPCVCRAWCWADQPCVCGQLGVVLNNHV